MDCLKIDNDIRWMQVVSGEAEYLAGLKIGSLYPLLPQQSGNIYVQVTVSISTPNEHWFTSGSNFQEFRQFILP